MDVGSLFYLHYLSPTTEQSSPEPKTDALEN